MNEDIEVQVFDVKVVVNSQMLKQLECLQYDDNSYINGLIADCDKISRTLRVERNNMDISHEEIFSFVDTLDGICDILKDLKKTNKNKTTAHDPERNIKTD